MTIIVLFVKPNKMHTKEATATVRCHDYKSTRQQTANSCPNIQKW